MFTKKELLVERIKVLKELKVLYKKETDLVKRAQNFKQFKTLCRDRRFDSLAGTFENKQGLHSFYFGGD